MTEIVNEGFIPTVFTVIQTDEGIHFIDTVLDDEIKRKVVLRCINMLKAVSDKEGSKIEAHYMSDFKKFSRFCYTKYTVVVVYEDSKGLERRFKMESHKRHADIVYLKVEEKLKELINFVV